MTPSIADTAASILDLHSEYSTTKTPAMVERQELLKELARELRPWAAEAGEDFGLELKTGHGGLAGNYGPVPWARVFGQIFSPKPTSGFYLVYLFAADGSGFDLSLNQGTSEWRSGKQRPINDQDELTARAAAARGALGDLTPDLAKRVGDRLDLGLPPIPVGPESIKRYQNYESANVWGIHYPRTAIPDDQTLTDDLDTFLPLLIDLYTQDTPRGAPHPHPRPGRPPRRRPRAGQGRVMDGPTRKAIENRAVKLATDHYTAAGWDVEDVGLRESYDLVCARDDKEKRIEVKGTTGTRAEVTLPRNEVLNARSYPDVALYVVTHITIEHTADGPVAAGGQETIRDPWLIDDHGALTPTEYRYRVASA